MIPINKIPFIGKNIEIVKSENHSLEGIQGEIIDETKHQFTIATNHHRKHIDKRAINFKIQYQGKTYMLNGKTINKTAEERIKTKVNL